MKELNLKSSNVLQRNLELFNDKKVRYIVNQGGTRSSKTYSICQLMILQAISQSNITLSIVRASFPALRGSVMRDFFEILNDLGLYSKRYHNKTENTYTFANGSMVEFFAIDDEQKVRGRKRDILYINEANELTSIKFKQLNFRTTQKILLDFNPSETTSWVYDLANKEDARLLLSTYKDNPFLAKDIVRGIEELKDEDEEMYNIYALGLRASSKKNVFNHFKFVPEKPDYFTEFIYAIDFGYNHPTAMLKLWHHEKEIFIEELIYESYLTTAELIKRFESLEIDVNIPIIADYARPEIIAEIAQSGFYIKNASKQVKKGIDLVKTYSVKSYNSSLNIKKEFQNYKWKTKGDMMLDEPVKLWDDAMDALRYGVMHIDDNNQGWKLFIY